VGVGAVSVTWACRGQRPRDQFGAVDMEDNSQRRVKGRRQTSALPLFSESAKAFGGAMAGRDGAHRDPPKGAQARTAGLVLHRGARDQAHVGSAKRGGRDPACASVVRRLCSGLLSQAGSRCPPSGRRRGTGSAARRGSRPGIDRQLPKAARRPGRRHWPCGAGRRIKST
jgi:hypothetical protein